MPIPLRLAVCLVLVSCGAVAAIQTGQPTPRDDLAKAIAEMRNLPAKLEGAEAAERGPRIQKAWETLIAAKDAGVAALLAEAKLLTASGERDDRFRLGAGSVVWQIGGLERVDEILLLWSDADFAVKYSYAFQVAGQAAQSKDPRALPLLLALLRDQRGEFYLANHVMTLAWPSTHLALWAPLGRGAGPALSKLLAAPPDPTTAASCAFLLASFWHTEALPLLRRLAREGEGPVRWEAVRSVGRFGHPDDHEWLVAGIASDDAELAAAHIAAVAAFGDLRAVPHVLARAKDVDERVRMTALRALVVLPTAEGIDLAVDWCGNGVGPEHDEIAYRLHLLFGDGEEADGYLALATEERPQRIARLRARQSEAMREQPGDRKLSHDELVDLCKAVAERGLVPEPFEWVAARHLLAAATAADVALLLDARGGLYRRFSDEQIEAIQQFERALLWLVRAQYRVDPGVCEQVQRRK